MNQHLPHALIVNFGEAFELLTGGLFKATIHRVCKPPQDQEKERRIGIIFFSRPASEYPLKPVASPLLKRLGMDQPVDSVVYNMREYLNARKHGYKRADFDHDRPKLEGIHAEQYPGDYHDPKGFKAWGKDLVPASVAT